MAQTLPISPFRDRILGELTRAGCLLLSAPTGSGKSTQVPQFLLDAPGKTLVLEPRRLSARSLAARVAAETRTELGGKIGYQVRFDSRCGAATSVLFQTYGLFLQRMLSDPRLPGVGAVLLDEFHERSLDCDLALAWLKRLRLERRELKLVVMSATLEEGALSRYLPDAARLDVPGRLFPVDIRHRPAGPRDDPAQGALAALRDLEREGLDGSVLVFMPGMREIRRGLEVLGPFCRERGLELLGLHGSMEPREQDRVLSPSEKKRVIVATNVAETGLTIPQVTMVVDSGLHRVAGYDAARGINTLYLARISLANADQRAGRAGRTAPGRCVRLWSKADETGMPESLTPEIARLELGGLRLAASSLPEEVDWLSVPPAAAWEEARRVLESLKAVDASGRVTQRGRALLAYPSAPRVAAVLEDARSLGAGAFERACAMAAVFETSDQLRREQGADLTALADDLLSGAGDFPRETGDVLRQLRRSVEPGPKGTPAPKGALERVWLAAFPDRLAAREGEGAYYRLANGRGALLAVKKDPPALILALDIRERAGGGRAREVGVQLYLPVAAETALSVFADECAWTKVSELDARRQRVVTEERLMFRGLVLDRRAPRKDDREASAEIWAEKFASGELEHPGLDERARQLVVRIGLMRKFYPDMGYPEMSLDDWLLIYGEVCGRRTRLKDIERVALLPHIESYLGPALAGFLARRLPPTHALPSGKTGRFTYYESQPAELKARLGDFIRMHGTLSLCDGRLPVSFDILGPNHRTVQKTQDLSSFWKNTYPAVKREMQRRYPKHPWP
ncbi:MAG: ATP-dependent helicase HrpB [Elusimicrobia bacterium]|nr:ATP-dependent helicase HrpB [Elusimicrobiota bacterium]